MVLACALAHGDGRGVGLLGCGDLRHEAGDGDLCRGAAAPAAFALDAVYPNPVSRTATIRFTLPDASSVRVVVYDALGRERAVLVDETRDAGVHTVSVDASALPSGVYVLRVQAGTHLQSRTFVVQR